MRTRRVVGTMPYVLRISAAGNGITASNRARALVNIFDPDHRVTDPADTLAQAFGISNQAAALVASLLSGDDLASFAASAGISRNTAKFHLRSVFASTGVARQSALLQLAAGLLRDIGEPDRQQPDLPSKQRRGPDAGVLGS